MHLIRGVAKAVRRPLPKAIRGEAQVRLRSYPHLRATTNAHVARRRWSSLPLRPVAWHSHIRDARTTTAVVPAVVISQDQEGRHARAARTPEHCQGCLPAQASAPSPLEVGATISGPTVRRAPRIAALGRWASARRRSASHAPSCVPFAMSTGSVQTVCRRSPTTARGLGRCRAFRNGKRHRRRSRRP